MYKISNELIQYISGFIDGKFYFIDQMYRNKNKFLPNQDSHSWYIKGYNDGNNYYLNKLSQFNNIPEFISYINNENINPIIEECFSQYQINEQKIRK